MPPISCSFATIGMKTVFLASSLALILTSALGVLAASFVANYVDPKMVRWVAGIGFIAVGMWTLLLGE